MCSVREGGLLSRRVSLGPGSVGDVRGRADDSSHSGVLSAGSPCGAGLGAEVCGERAKAPGCWGPRFSWGVSPSSQAHKPRQVPWKTVGLQGRNHTGPHTGHAQWRQICGISG